MSTKETRLLESAEKIAASSSGWADVSNALFDPEEGLITRAYPSREEREAFLKTEEYRAIRELISTAMKQSGLAAGASPEKSGKFVVRLPKSLHAALEKEATAEGVSLNQLVVTKLAIQLSHVASSSRSVAGTLAESS